VGSASTGSTTKKASKTFVDGSFVEVFNGTSTNTFSWDMGQLDLPPGASSLTVKAISFYIHAFNDDNDESFDIMLKIGSNNVGWVFTGGSSFGLSGNDHFDWNFAEENLNWTYTSNQTVQFTVWDENETCFGCSNDEVELWSIEGTVYYEYTTSAQHGDILAEGRIYANSTYEVGDLAEYFEVKDAYANPGQIVSLEIGSEDQYKLSNVPYDPHMVGVISENPSVVLNNPSVGPAVGLAGRVTVQLVPNQELIKSGDFITTSTIPGCNKIST
jgi:hypothetical protein